MQQPKPSGVLDRVRWIEKTHGPANTPPPPRTRPRLPKQFEPAAAEPKSPAPTLARSPRPDPARLSRVDEAPSPVLSDSSTAKHTESPRIDPPTPDSYSKASAPAYAPTPDSHSKAYAPTPNSHSKASAPVFTPKHADALKPAPAQMKHAPSPKPPAARYESDYDDDDTVLYKHRNSSSSDIEVLDPVHVGAITPPEMRGPEPPASFKTLGGIRSRTRPKISRRFAKSHQSRQSASGASIHSSHDSDHEAHIPPPLRNSQSLTSIHAERDDVASNDSSLLARLTSLTANRPNVQDLVSNRSGPKFVKRSHHYNATPFKNDSPAPTYANTWGRSERRFK